MKEKMDNMEQMEDEYRGEFVPRVHQIGRFTHLAALLLSLLILAYFLFFRGYRYDTATPYLAYLTLLIPGLANLMTEPLTYWPLIGSAGIYMSYLAGSCMNLRVPVGLSAMNATNTRVDTPKGQLVTIISIAVSVVANIGALLVIVLLGMKLIDWIPASVKAAFIFLAVSLAGFSMSMRLGANESGNILQGVRVQWPYLLAGSGTFFVLRFLHLPSLIGPIAAMAVCGLLGYIQFIKSEK